MGRNRTAAQKTRNRRWLRSIEKQQSKGIEEPNTDKYDRWGRRRGEDGDDDE